MTFYKILQRPSGLFFHPTIGWARSEFERNHLSKNGKLYTRKPSWHYVDSGISPSDKHRFPKQDFMVVECEVVEIRETPF